MAGTPIPPVFSAHPPASVEPGQMRDWTHRQFKEVAQDLQNIRRFLTTPVHEARISGPVLVTEGNSPLTIVSIDVPDLELGWYHIAVNFRSTYVEANDRLNWHIEGTFDLGPFIKESKAAGESIPMVYGSTLEANGPMQLTLIASTDGPGAANVTIDAAAITITRVIG